MDWNAIITAMAWIAFVISVGLIVTLTIYFNFVLNSMQKTIYSLNLGTPYLIAIVSGTILYFG